MASARCPATIAARRSPFLQTALIATAIASCGGQPESGDGPLRHLRVTGRRGVNESAVSPDGRFVVFSTTGPGPELIVTDGSFSHVASKEGGRDIAFPVARSDVLATFSINAFEVLALPALERRDRLSPDIAVRMHLIGGRPILCPFREGLIIVGRDIHITGAPGSVVEIGGAPLRIGRTGKARIEDPLAAAADARTGKLVICDVATAEVYDLDRMETGACCSLECPATHSVCAGDGRAWIATTKGKFLHFDIESATVTGRTVLTEARPDPLKRTAHLGMRLDVSPSGRFLAAASSFCAGDGVFDTQLRMYRVDGGELAEIASTRTTMTHAVNDLTILEKEQVVIVATPLPVLTWHFGTDGKR